MRPRTKQNEIAIYFISSPTPKEKEWVRLFVDSESTKYEVNRNGEVRNKKTGELLKPDKTNYYVYRLELNDGRIIHLSMHRLLACLFIPIPMKYIEQGKDQMYLVPNHKDGNKLHTTLDNLEWTDVSENTQHAFDMGLADNSRGEKSHLATITDEQAKEICELLSQKIRPMEVAEITGIPITIVRHIYSGETWKHFAKDYDFQKSKDRSIPFSISDDTIHAICKLIELDRYNDADIASMTNVSKRYVNDIRRGNRRTDISSQYNFPVRDKKKEMEEKVRKACEMIQDNKWSRNEIAKETGLDPSTVSNIRSGKIYQEISREYGVSPREITSDEVIHKACELLANTQLTYKEIGERTGLSKGYITQLKAKKLKPNISSQYDFSNRDK